MFNFLRYCGLDPQSHSLHVIKKVAFTLAEVLITLGIIGIVAAMTLPAVINNIKAKELETRLQKAYSVLQSALQQMNYDEGQTVNAISYTWHFSRTFKKYFKTSDDAAKGYDGSGQNEDGKIDYISHVYKSYNNKPANMAWFDDGNAFLSDGMFILVENMKDSGFIVISVDVNGYQKKPNRYGHDVFAFQVMDNGKLLPLGAPGTRISICSLTSADGLNGLGCTYKALTEKDYFKNLPK